MALRPRPRTPDPLVRRVWIPLAAFAGVYLIAWAAGSAIREHRRVRFRGASPVQGVSARMIPLERAFFEGEGIELTCEVMNVSEEIGYYPWVPELAKTPWGDYSVEIRPPFQVIWRSARTGATSCCSYSFTTRLDVLRPGELMTISDSIGPLPAGEYSVRIRFRGGLDTPWTRIVVLPRCN